MNEHLKEGRYTSITLFFKDGFHFLMGKCKCKIREVCKKNPLEVSYPGLFTLNKSFGWRSSADVKWVNLKQEKAAVMQVEYQYQEESLTMKQDDLWKSSSQGQTSVSTCERGQSRKVKWFISSPLPRNDLSTHT